MKGPLCLIRAWLLSFSFLILFISLNGCSSWPRIIVVKDPLTIEEHLRLGAIYESRGEIDIAIKEYRRVLSMDRENPEALFFLGNAYFSKDDLKEAEFFYKKVIEGSRDFQRKGMVYNNLAWVYIKGNSRLEEAEKLSKEAVKLDIANSPIYLDTLGVVYMTMGDYTSAEQVILKGLEKASDEDHIFLSEALTHLSEVYRAMGLDDKARETIERANEYRGNGTN